MAEANFVRFINNTAFDVFICVSSNGGEGDTSYWKLSPGLEAVGWERYSDPVTDFVSRNANGASARYTKGLRRGNTYIISDDLSCE